MDDVQQLRQASRFHPTSVWRQGNIVLREARPWSRTVQAFLRHLEAVGFAAAPRVVGSGFDDQGRETLTFIEGETKPVGPWSLDACWAIGRIVRDLHKAGASFVPPDDAVWFDWQGRISGSGRRVISHCDMGSWNIVVRDELPYALIDWERSGPVDSLRDLAEVCWLNAKLFDDVTAGVEGLPPIAERARHLRAIVDGYELPRAARHDVMDTIVDVVVRATAEQADEAQVLPQTRSGDVDAQVLWAMAWRARSAVWIIENSRTFEAALL